MSHLPTRLAAFALAASCAAPAHAAIFTVGTPSGAGQPCTHGTIQAAINAANSSAGADTIRLTRTLTYEPEANSINTAQELTIEGGYATCTQATADATRTVVSGAGGAHAPVFTITAPTGALIHLRNLTISGGDVDGAGLGGGIRFEGDGVLDIADSAISNNTAGYGGGIYARGTGTNAELNILNNVSIVGNTARYDGGGVYASQIETSMTAPGSILFNNRATGVASGAYTGGYGGGLYVQAGTLSSYAYIGTSGVGSLGAIAYNQALYGGGVALGGANGNHGTSAYSVLQLFTTDPAHRGRIANNAASVSGGAIHATSTDGGVFDGDVFPYAYVWNAELDANTAPNGAAVHLVGGMYTWFGFNQEGPASPWPSQALRCGTGTDCGRISNNATAANGGGYTDGAILAGSGAVQRVFNLGCSASASCALPTGGIVIEGNQGGRLLDSSTGIAEISNALIEGNQFSQGLIRTDYLTLRDSTLAGNTIGANPLLSTSSRVTIQRSLLWQPGLVMLQHSGTMAVDHVLASEINSLGGNFGGGGECGGGACAVLADPRFVDPAHGDYSLRVASPAIDRAPPLTGDDRDVYGRPRDQGLAHIWAANGVRDLGAFERQSLQPMVLNGDFDFSDLRLWTSFGGAWDGTQNAAGGSGSGSWTMNASGLPYRDVTVGEQCVRLPGPGRYLMNGWGKGGGNTLQSRDYAVLAWEYRRQGGYDCNVGTLDAFGELTLGGGTAWGHPAQPAALDVAESDFVTGSPSIKLRLIARDGNPTNVGGSITAWFDGITLEVEDGDVIFANGFD